MTFALTVYLSSDSLTLTSNPYSLVSATGLGGAGVRRVNAQGPAQDGDTDKGYRLTPRSFRLVVGITAATDALLDSYRDALVSIFKPVPDTPQVLEVTRDDTTARRLDCYLDGEIDIALDPKYRPGHYLRLTIPLYAPEAAYYAVSPGTASIVGPITFSDTWWLAGGAIGTAQVLMHGGTPANNEAWSWTGSLSASDTMTLAIRAGSVSAAGSISYMFRDTAGATRSPRFYRQTDTGGVDAGNPRFYYAYDQKFYYGMPFGTHNYFYEHVVETNFSAVRLSVDDVQQAIHFYPGAVDGATMLWRAAGYTSGTTWPGTVQFYALYNPKLSAAQRSALNAYMSGTVGTVATSVSVAYLGDLDEYPVLSLTGPVTSPVITNTATGETLDFGTITIGAGTTYVIDTRYGQKSVLFGTVDRKYQLSTDSDLDTWHLAPDPVAPAGVNVITLGGTAIGTATTLQVVYYNRYSSF